MRGDDRDNTACAEQESLAARLLGGVCRLIPDLDSIAVNQRVLSHASAHHTLEKKLGFGQGRIRLAIMPVDDLKGKFVCQLKVHFLSMQMEHVAPKTFCRFNCFPVEYQAKHFIFFEAEELSLRVLDRVKNAVDPYGARGFDKKTSSFCNCFQSLHHGTGMMV